jgi:hypothetical protein
MWEQKPVAQSELPPVLVTINQPASFYQQPLSSAPNLIDSKPGIDLPNQTPI